MEERYYIEDLRTGTCLMQDDSWEPFLEVNNHLFFNDKQSALQVISSLDAGHYRVFSRIIVS